MQKIKFKNEGCEMTTLTGLKPDPQFMSRPFFSIVDELE